MKTKLVALILLVFLQYVAFTQNNVGIGIANPNPNSIIELFANNKGLLIPRLTDAERLAIPAGATEAGLLVYGKTDNLFYYWDGSQWIPFPGVSLPAYNLTIQFDSVTGVLSITDGGGTLNTVISLPAVSSPAYNLTLQFDSITKVLSITDGGGTLTTVIPPNDDEDWSRDPSAGVLFPYTLSDQVAIGGNTANSTAILDVQSTTMGVLIPRMTTVQRLTISSPATGLRVFDITAGVTMFYNGTRWLEVGAVPIGTIMAFHKSFTGTPALPWGWAECNGQALADSESPFDGSALPDLNGSFTTEAGTTSSGGRFLRGDTTSGTLSSDQTNNIAQIGADGNNGCGTCSATIPQNGNWPSTQTPGYDRSGSNTSMRVRHRGVETYPGNMAVVWIMRVK